MSRSAARHPTKRARLREALAGMDPEPIITRLESLVTEQRKARLSEVIAQRVASVTVVMDAPHNPHNGAAVLRSCDAFGVYRVHIVERSEAFSASNAVAKGTERWVDAIGYPTVGEAVAALRNDGFTLVGTHPAGRLVPGDLRTIERLALVMGNEHDGICRDLAAQCDDQVRVPMRGFVESLNVSVTAAVLLSHATAERSGDVDALERRRLYARALTLTVPRALDVLAAGGIVLPDERLASG